jgi:hypothetical protein
MTKKPYKINLSVNNTIDYVHHFWNIDFHLSVEAEAPYNDLYSFDYLKTELTDRLRQAIGQTTRKLLREHEVIICTGIKEDENRHQKFMTDKHDQLAVLRAIAQEWAALGFEDDCDEEFIEPLRRFMFLFVVGTYFQHAYDTLKKEALDPGYQLAADDERILEKLNAVISAIRASGKEEVKYQLAAEFLINEVAVWAQAAPPKLPFEELPPRGNLETMKQLFGDAIKNRRKG